MRWWRTIVLTSTSVLLGCGCGPGGSDPAARFIGRWEYRSGTEAFVCAALSPPRSSRTAAGIIDLSRSTVADLRYDDLDACVLELDVDGLVASVAPGQSCPSVVPVPDGTTGTLTFTPDLVAFTLAESGDTLTQSGSGGASLLTGQQTLPCSIEIMATLERSMNRD